MAGHISAVSMRHTVETRGCFTRSHFDFFPLRTVPKAVTIATSDK